MSENSAENQASTNVDVADENIVEDANRNAGNIETDQAIDSTGGEQQESQQKEDTAQKEPVKEKKSTKNEEKIQFTEDKNIATTSTQEILPDNAFCDKLSNHSSNISILCRICYDDTLDEPIISPCKCKGTVGMMHKSCLEKWLAESNTNRCDLCFHRFETERTTKFSVGQSLYRWIRYPPSSFAFQIRDMRSDMITCMILIPFSFLLIYLCLFAAEYYNRQGFTIIPVARWTAISVMFMGIVIVLGFCTWVYLVVRYHSRVWYFWWQRETIVRINLKVSNELRCDH